MRVGLGLPATLTLTLVSAQVLYHRDKSMQQEREAPGLHQVLHNAVWLGPSRKTNLKLVSAQVKADVKANAKGANAEGGAEAEA